VCAARGNQHCFGKLLANWYFRALTGRKFSINFEDYAYRSLCNKDSIFDCLAGTMHFFSRKAARAIYQAFRQNVSQPALSTMLNAMIS
jgi:hypothetical protein